MDKIIFIATAWGSKHGGINSFNYDLCRSLGSLHNKKISITCITSSISENDYMDAARLNLDLISVDEPKNICDAKEINDLLVNILSTKQKCWIVGHDIVTGGIALDLNNYFIKKNVISTFVLFHHMDFEAYEGFKIRENRDVRTKIALQIKILNSAEIIIAIGPKLYNSAINKVKNHRIGIFQIIPGLQEISGRNPIGNIDLRVFTFGRYDQSSDVLKQIRLAAAGFGRAKKIYNEILGGDASLTIVGLSNENEDRDLLVLKEITKKYSERICTINGYPYSENRKELFEELQRNHVCLMLSVHEGFGLAGLEAISAEIPLIISKNTGLFLFIKNEFGEFGINATIPIDIRGSEDPLNENDIDQLVDKLKEVSLNKEKYRELACLLKKQFLLKGYNWENTATNFLNIIKRPISETGQIVDNSKLVQINLHNLPITQSEIFGRNNIINKISRSWKNKSVKIFELVADAGVGKTAVINYWSNSISSLGFDGAEKVFGWSFFEQGYKENFISSDLFMHSALAFFGDLNPNIGSPTEKGKRLALLANEIKFLIILDGLESLQFPPGDSNEGKLKDEAILVFLKELASNLLEKNGLCVVTTRIRIYDLHSFERSSVKCEMLSNISPDDGARLLRSAGAIGKEADLQYISSKFKGNCLILKLVGSFLSMVDQNILVEVNKITSLRIPDKRDVSNFKKVMISYENWFGPSSIEISILHLISLFDRPIKLDILIKLAEESNKKFNKLKREEFILVIRKLNDLSLVDFDSQDRISYHPLIKEYCAEKFMELRKELWKKLNTYLFQYYCENSDEHPKTLEKMDGLFQAVVFGIKGSLYAESIEIYKRRIMQGSAFYAANKLGAYGSLITVLQNFFQNDRGLIVDEISIEDKLFILKEAAEYYTILLGYANQTANDCYNEAQKISDSLLDKNSYVEVLLGKCRYFRMRGQLEKSGKIAQELIDLSRIDGNFRPFAYRAMSTYLFYIGAIKEAYNNACVNGISYNSLDEGLLRAKFDINEPYLSCLGYQALCLWLMGKFADAHEILNKVMRKAELLDHPHTMIVVKFIECMIYHFESDTLKTNIKSRELIYLCSKHGVKHWKLAGEILYYWSMDDRVSHLSLIKSIEEWERTGASLFLPYWKSMLADHLYHRKKFNNVILLMDSVLDYSETWWQPKLWHWKAKASSKLKKDQHLAKDFYEKAIQIAENQESYGLLLLILEDASNDISMESNVFSNKKKEILLKINVN